MKKLIAVLALWRDSANHMEKTLEQLSEQEKSLSNQFFFVDDILPTLFGALDINPNQNNITGVNRWNDLIKNEIKPPKNVMTGNVIVHDERALFNDKWKLYYRKFIYDNESEEIFELYDILNDPYEKYDLSQEHPEILESMKKTFLFRWL